MESACLCLSAVSPAELGRALEGVLALWAQCQRLLTGCGGGSRQRRALVCLPPPVPVPVRAQPRKAWGRCPAFSALSSETVVPVEGLSVERGRGHQLALHRAARKQW